MGAGLTLRYYRVCIPDLEAEEYLRKDNQEAKWDAQGQAKGQAQALLTVLKVRGIPVSNEARQQILDTTDHRLLLAWLERAVVAQSIDEVLKPVD